MKIWFQTFSPNAHVDPRWHFFDEQCRRHLPRVARPDTEFHIATVDLRGSKMIFSDYIQYMHIGQVIENALKAERDGFDAFVTAGGTVKLTESSRIESAIPIRVMQPRTLQRPLAIRQSAGPTPSDN